MEGTEERADCIQLAPSGACLTLTVPEKQPSGILRETTYHQMIEIRPGIELTVLALRAPESMSYAYDLRSVQAQDAHHLPGSFCI